ncbi:MAG: metal ABC transporter ATP-binding protein [Clostridia bacterium]|nr:metal ABC transporter ATP-binding protein [Clostridia bacterium]
MTDLITCNGITVHNERTLALRDVTFSVKKGEFLTIVGENGAGKSTLVQVILGIRTPEEGNVEIDRSVIGKIGYLPQQSSAQRDFPASVYEVVLSGNIGATGLFPFYSRAQKARAKGNMELLGITALAKKSYRALSGGQQQRVLLARALCAADAVLLLDEPTAGLDPLVTKDLYATVRHLCTEHGMTIVMVSHDIAAAMKYSDRILHLATSVRFLGTPAEYQKTPLGASFGSEENENA